MSLQSLSEAYLAEHERIERMVNVLEALALQLEGGSGREPVFEALARALSWLDRCASCHHEKEERHLFSRLREEPALQEEVRALLREHTLSDLSADALRSELERARSGLVDANLLRVQLAGYAARSREHIAEEGAHLLYPLELSLDAAQAAELLEELQATELELLGEGGLEAMQDELERLELACGLRKRWTA